MSVRLFVGNLSYDVAEQELRELFSAVGQVSFISIPKDRETNKPRGFAFVEFSDKAAADEAIRRFNNQQFKGRPLSINEARERESGGRPSPSPRPPMNRPARTEDFSPDASPMRDKPSRNFGPDAAPRRSQKKSSHGGKSKGGPKQPLREKTGGRFFGVDDDDSFDDESSMPDENLASHLSEDEEEENT